MKIEVFTKTGCEASKQAFNTVKMAVAEVGLDADVYEIKDKKRFQELGVTHVPAVAVDGNIVFSGTVPTISEVINIISREF